MQGGVLAACVVVLALMLVAVGPSARAVQVAGTMTCDSLGGNLPSGRWPFGFDATANDMGKRWLSKLNDVTMVVDDLLRGVLAGAPGAVAITKRLLRGGVQTFDEMQRLSDELFRSVEGMEGMRSFAERRPPSWQQ